MEPRTVYTRSGDIHIAYQVLGQGRIAAVALLRMNTQIDIRHVLPTIRVPTLVVHRTGDLDVSVEDGRWLAAQIPGARFVELAGSPEFDRTLATVLFADIVGSTALVARLGDRAWQEILDQHNALVRTELNRFRGREVDTAGDGFFATFDGPARAIRCACSIRDGARKIGLEMRAGLHTGEVELAAGSLRGIALHIGARVAAAAQPGEVLVSSTVKDLVAGSGISFTERGAHALKGVPGEWQLFAVT